MNTREAIDKLKELKYNLSANWSKEGNSVQNAFRIAIEALEKAEKYRWHDLRADAEDIPEDWLDNIMTVDSNGQVAIHGIGFSTNGRGGGIMELTMISGKRVYVDEVYNNILGMLPGVPRKEKLSDCTHIIAWRYIEPFEGAEE